MDQRGPDRKEREREGKSNRTAWQNKQKARAVEFEPYCHDPLGVCDLPYAFELQQKKKANH